MAGLGTTSLGWVALGYGTPVVATAPPPLPVGSPYLNTTTRDYVVSSDGGLQRMPSLRHRVVMLLSTELGSAAHEPTIGVRIPDKIDQSFVQRAQQSVRDCLAILAGELRIDSIPVDVYPSGRVAITVNYTDLTTGNSGTVTV